MSTGEAGDQLHELREAIEGLDLPVHGAVLTEARALLDRFTAALAAAEADYWCPSATSSALHPPRPRTQPSSPP